MLHGRRSGRQRPIPSGDAAIAIVIAVAIAVATAQHAVLNRLHLLFQCLEFGCVLSVQLEGDVQLRSIPTCCTTIATAIA
jgi:hypothetical protein